METKMFFCEARPVTGWGQLTEGTRVRAMIRGQWVEDARMRLHLFSPGERYWYVCHNEKYASGARALRIIIVSGTTIPTCYPCMPTAYARTSTRYASEKP